MSDIKLKPLADRVAIKRLEAEEKSAGGIVIPGNAAEKPIKGTVVAVGKGKVLDNGQVRELSVKKGDTVYFGKYAGTEIKEGTEQYLIMREDDIFAIVE